MSTAIWHDAPECPRCNGPFGTPARFSERLGMAGPCLLWCPACGWDWDETDMTRVARAWYSRGAWDGLRLQEARK